MPGFREKGGRPLLGGEFFATLSLVALKLAVSLWVLRAGFTHVSDDDYSRVVIAEAFAQAPRLDPSGTSWLPFPFWLNGAVMMLFGRSLAVARVVAVGSAIGGVVLVHRALVRLPVVPWLAWVAVALSMCAPWSAWLGVATVPEALTAALTVVGALTLRQRRAHVWGALALLVASLSRYESWPVAAVFAGVCLYSSREGPMRARLGDVVAAFVAVLGPAAWMGWNRHSHGDTLHFLRRVVAFRQREGGVATWTLYPHAFTDGDPLLLGLLGLGALGLVLDRDLRRRWGWPLVATFALALFLIEGDLRNGAPTHHPERALVAVFWIVTAFGLDGARIAFARVTAGRSSREAWAVAVVSGIMVAWFAAWPDRVANHPARSDGENRGAELAIGDDLRVRHVSHVVIAPCMYEHFAVIAAFGAPERVTVEPSSSVVVRPGCPHIEER